MKLCEKSGERTGSSRAGALDEASRVVGTQALRSIGQSASLFRYQPAPDRNVALRERIIQLAYRHRRYGAGMIYLKLRQSGHRVKHKRVERLYTLENPQVRRRRRTKVPMSDRQPLIRPAAANEVWSVDFVFDQVASGRAIKCLVIVDDATHEAVAIAPEHSLGGQHLVCVLKRICGQRGYPHVIRSDNVLRTEASDFSSDRHPACAAW